MSDESDSFVAESYKRTRKQKSLSATASRKLKIEENRDEEKRQLDTPEIQKNLTAVSYIRTKSAKISFNPKVESNMESKDSQATQNDSVKSVKSNLKRPKTSLPVLNSSDTQISNQKKPVDGEEMQQFQPRGDQRYINLYESINEVYSTNGSDHLHMDPTERLNGILCTRSALQGNRTRGVAFEKDSSILMKIENNKKLFRKTVLNLF